MNKDVKIYDTVLQFIIYIIQAILIINIVQSYFEVFNHFILFSKNQKLLV